MNENKETNNVKDDQVDLEQDHYFENQRERDRRGESSEGLSTLGQWKWIYNPGPTGVVND